MSFFYNLNKTLDAIREKPELTHGQLNERDMGKHNNKTTGFDALAKKAAKEYGSKAAGERVAGAQFQKMKKAGKLEEQDMDEGLGDAVKKVGSMAKKLGQKAITTLGHGDDAAMMRDLQKKMGVPQTGEKPTQVKEGEAEDKLLAAKIRKMLPAYHKRMEPEDAYQEVAEYLGISVERLYDVLEVNEGVDKEAFAALAEPKDKITFADKIAGAKKEVDEMLGDVAAEAMKSALSGGQKKLDKNKNGKLDANDFEMLRKGGKQSTAEASGAIDFDKVLDAIAALYGDDMWENDAMQDLANDLEQAGPTDRELDFIIAKGKLPKRLAGIKFSAGDNVQFGEGFPTVAGARAEMNKRKVGDVTHGAKHDTEETPTGRRVTRRTDPNTGYSVGSDTDDEGNAKSTEKRGRGRPKSASKAPERVTAKATKHKGGRKTNEEDMSEGPDEGSDLVKLAKVIQSCKTMDQLEAARKMAQNFLRKHSTANDGMGFAGLGKDYRRRDAAVSDIQRKKAELQGGQELDEKAVSKKQQKFMGMVHATQKGEKAPSKEVAKVAKIMKKGDAEDFAATKHKGLPEKKKPEGKKKEKTEEAGGTSTPTASSGFSFGQGIYDSMNRDLESMIAESMSINVSSSTEGGKNITVTASEEDAVKLAAILKSAGLGGDSEGYGGGGYKSACGCGTPDCSCGDEAMDEAAPAVSDNSPDWPTNQETAQDNFEYSGGLNKPKSTGQTTTPIIHTNDEERQHSYAEAEEDAIKRMMEMAGIKEGKKPDFLDVDKDGNKAEPFKKAVKDKEEKKVDESILAATANLWSEYKGKYGV